MGRGQRNEVYYRSAGRPSFIIRGVCIERKVLKSRKKMPVILLRKLFLFFCGLSLLAPRGVCYSLLNGYGGTRGPVQTLLGQAPQAQ